MPGARPDNMGPVCAVTAWRARTSRVGLTCSASAGASAGVSDWSSGSGCSVTPANSTGASRNLLPVNHQTVPLSTQSIPQTVLDPEPPDAVERLAAALSEPGPARRDAGPAGVAGGPRFLDAWARLGEVARDPVEAYAYFRVGYHRGLDRLRQSGWRGSGYVRWRHESNRGFLRSLDGLRRTAAAIGEDDEAERCAQFLRQLDPDWPPPDRT